MRALTLSSPCSWLFEGLGRDKAEELLQLPDTKIGSFMIRESETKKGEQPPTHLPMLGSDKQVWLLADSFMTRSPSLLPRTRQSVRGGELPAAQAPW